MLLNDFSELFSHKCLKIIQELRGDSPSTRYTAIVDIARVRLISDWQEGQSLRSLPEC